MRRVTLNRRTSSFRSIKSFMLIPLFTLLTACGGVDVIQYADRSPKFDLFQYFTGQTRGWGVVMDRSGTVTRQFVVDIVGTESDDNTIVLDEDFIWNDGEKTKRIWTITKTGPQSYSGSADDVSGTASGKTAGNALNWTYVLKISVGDDVWNITFDDWMFLQPDGVLLNKAIMSKWGIRVGEVIISFSKPTTS